MPVEENVEYGACLPKSQLSSPTGINPVGSPKIATKMRPSTGLVAQEKPSLLLDCFVVAQAIMPEVVSVFRFRG